jgi:hypothetical protein
MKRVLTTTVVVGKGISFTYSGWVFVALGTQHAKRMLLIILSSVVCLTVLHFSTYLIHSTISGKELVNTD